MTNTIFYGRFLSLLALVLLCSACLKTPSPQQLASANYGTAPVTHEETVKSFMRPKLFDPYSAVYDFGTPFRGYYNHPPIQGGGIAAFGYFVPVTINAKNRFGAYVGTKAYVFFFKNDRMVGICNRPKLAGTYYCR